MEKKGGEGNKQERIRYFRIKRERIGVNRIKQVG
jgi:hypothetical protein